MGEESKFIRKIKRLLKRLGMPRWLHRFGPKTYEFYEHFSALIIRHFCRLSYRRVRKLLNLIGIRCPKKSALQSTAAKLGTSFWDMVLKMTSGKPYLLAIDSTGFSRSNPSYHYLRRIDGTIPKIPVKASIAFDTRRKKVVAARIRVLPAHDIKDVKVLLKKSKPTVFVADKAYDAAWLHEFCQDQKIKAHIPIRNYGKPRFHRWDARQIAIKHFRKRSYHRRELVESGNHSIKQTMGASVSSKKVATIRSEVFCRLVCHNLFYWLFLDSGQTLHSLYFYILKKFFTLGWYYGISTAII
jgi:hypothetical protein